MRRYETILIADPDLPEDEMGVLIERIKNFLAKEKGEIIKLEQWGKRKLAYEIEKKNKGFYIFLDYLGNPELAHKFETSFRINEKVLRCQTIKVEEDTCPEAGRQSYLRDQRNGENSQF